MKSGDKLKTFNIGCNKPGKNILKKLEDHHKKKEEEEQTQKVFQDFVATFEGDSKQRTWVKGGVVNPGSDGGSSGSSSESRIYKPVSKISEKQSNADSAKPESKPSLPEKPPSLGKRRGKEQKKSKLEQFKEELKLIQQQREQRHALRQGKNVSPSAASTIHSELDLSDVGSRSREYRNPPLGFTQQSSGVGLLGDSGSPSNIYGRRSQRDRRDDYPYDFDGDRTTTNLFLGNLNPKMTEQQLCEAFGRYGPLASVKIMWPRTDEERSRGRNCGFVAFMNRKDGERALDNIRGKELMGFEMKLGWGKSVPIPLYPIYIPPALLELIKPPPPSGLPFNAQPRDWLKSLRSAIKERAKLVTDGVDPEATRPPAADRKPFDVNKMSEDELGEVLKDAIVKVVIPSDRSILALIHRMIEFVVLEGPQFEAAIMHREQNNPQFKFLFDYQSSEHTYYRWKLWSVLHGESVNNWRTDEFRMFENGPLWRPPPMNLFSGGMPEDLVEEDDYPYAPGYVPPLQARRHDAELDEAMALSRQCGLTEAQRGRFTQMLVDLEPSRANVGDVMVWCLEHADAASDITDCVVDALSFTSSLDQSEAVSSPKNVVSEMPDESKAKPSLSVSKAVARLFLISDILHNSSAKVPNASYFRKCFERRLPDVFLNLHALYESVDGKLKAEQLKQKVMLCFHAWDDWAIYPNDYLIRLQNIFLGLVSEIDDESDLAGVPLELEGAAVIDVSSKSLPTLDPDVEMLQGQPLVQYDGDPLDVDGSPLDDTDQEDKPIAKKPKESVINEPKVVSPDADSSSTRLFVPSKWETVDPATVESQAVTTTSRWELLTDGAPTQLTEPNNHVRGVRESGMERSVKLGRWDDLSQNSTNDDELDGQPLTGIGALVAYDDEDAMSPVSSGSADSPALSAIPLPPSTSTNTASKSTSSSGVTTSTTLSEERRAMLREIESKVLKYQDELEATRKGDKSITEEAITKQIQRYRERLLERLQEDDQLSCVPKSKNLSDSKLKPPNARERPNVGSSIQSLSSKHPRRDHSISPPASRDSRDRSPPRSFRENDRPRRRPPSPTSPDASSENEAYDSSPLRNLRNPSVPSTDSPYRRDTDDVTRRPRLSALDDAERERNSYGSSQKRLPVPPEELEEGEASDDEDFGSTLAQRLPSRRKHHGRDDTHGSTSPKTTRKRHRSRTPNSVVEARHAYRSRTPSPSRRRSELSAGSASRRRKK
ncbi:hypothetical protein CRM22_003175 [Opisthorchis felineus]|uniref:U2 snRNP-associated SURP motif-containing protein n=1 Tax=Opisthorchis felineus TaxID=147828 RepID=A0A4S2M2L5_OPIFE|nr:hypothetical protein CRM22_003175 [Opisthorchis felineus]